MLCLITGDVLSVIGKSVPQYFQKWAVQITNDEIWWRSTLSDQHLQFFFNC